MAARSRNWAITPGNAMESNMSKSITVVGAGLVGRGWAIVFARAGYAVRIVLKREVPGFVVNRLQVAILGEAFRLVEDGVIGALDLDHAIADGLGLRWSFMGPFETIDLNAPGGIRDYVERFGQPYYEIALEQGPARKWNESLVSMVEQQRRQVLAADQLQDRQRWRDLYLMSVIANKNSRKEV